MKKASVPAAVMLPLSVVIVAGLALSAFRDYAREQKKAVFIVTHENDAYQYADRVFKMDGGRLLPSGELESRPRALSPS